MVGGDAGERGLADLGGRLMHVDAGAAILLFLALLVLTSYGGSTARGGGAGTDERRAASRAAAAAVRHTAIEDTIKRRSTGDLSEDDARVLLQELLAGPRPGGGPAARPPRG